MQLRRERPVWPSALFVAALALAGASAAQAQPSPRAGADPFAAIVGDPDGANAQLNDVTLPVRNPTAEELRQYLAAFQVLNASATLTLDDPTRSEATFRTPKPVSFGPFKAPNGTRLRVAGGFHKRPGEEEAVLRTLEIVPDREITAMGLAKFRRAYLDEKGVLHFQASAALIGRQEVTVEKVYRDREGNLRFKLGGDGLGGTIFAKGVLGGELRVLPDGRVERWSRGFLGLNLISTGWEPVKDLDGKQVQVPFLAGIRTWPPRASELVDMIGAAESTPVPGAPTDPIAASRAVLDAIPVSALEVRFQGKADPKEIRLSGGEGTLRLSDHELELVSHGRFKGRTYHTDAGLPNSYRLTGTVSGQVSRAGTRARLDRVHFDLRGTHGATIPFDDPTKTVLDAALESAVDVQLSDVRTELPDGTYLVVPGQVRAGFRGEGSLTLRPLGGEDRSELRIDRRKNHYDLSVSGPVEVGGMRLPGPATLPERMVLQPVDGRPVLQGSGTLGTKMGFLFTKTELDLEGTTATPGAVGILEGSGATRREVKTTLKPGARVKLHLYTFAGVKESALEGLVAASLGGGAPTQPLELGAVNATVDARISGEATNTVVSGPELELVAPGARLDARVASSVRLGTPNGAETEVRGAAAEAHLELTAPAELEAGLPGQPRLRGTAGAGTRVDFTSGELRRDPRSGVLSGQGARLEAHLVLTQGSLAHQDLALALKGRMEVDLTAVIGFKVDPRAALSGGAPVSEPVDLDLALSLELAPGTVIGGQQAGSSGQLRLRGATTITAHARAKVDPRTGSPTLGGLSGIDVSITADGLDLQALLAPLGSSVTASTSGRSTVRLRQASFEMLADGGLRIRHQGLSVELAPGELVVRPTRTPDAR